MKSKSDANAYCLNEHNSSLATIITESDFQIVQQIQEKVSEYHTGYRAFSREVLETIPMLENSDDFIFDNQIMAQIFYFGFQVGEVSCPAKYFPEASSINAQRSLIYGFGCLQFCE